eukprot:TRINITY_DN1147_c0_g1_i8.p1 TRINITY_DN1147_c0_g1~~TRINITY_DN1147_c0_g1_i8.p1  ORF type:complete len:502 (+),score=93.18 TRINITY_DN1147_c0_g1_i8:195-1700(+)
MSATTDSTTIVDHSHSLIDNEAFNFNTAVPITSGSDSLRRNRPKSLRLPAGQAFDPTKLALGKLDNFPMDGVQSNSTQPNTLLIDTTAAITTSNTPQTNNAPHHTAPHRPLPLLPPQQQQHIEKPHHTTLNYPPPPPTPTSNPTLHSSLTNFSVLTNGTTSNSNNNSTASTSSGSTGKLALSAAEIEYADYLQRAQTETFIDIAGCNFIYRSGTDSMNRPVIVVIGAHLPAKRIDMERVMLYAIKILDPVVESDYVLVYVHTSTSSDNTPTFAWLRKLYSIFNRKYKKNLKLLYIVHPTMWVKLTFRLFQPFLSTKFWRKVVYVDDTAQLQKFFGRDLGLPAMVFERDGVVRSETGVSRGLQIFGVPLEEVMSRPENAGVTVPPIIDRSIEYLRARALNQEGLFRISGSNSLLKELKRNFDDGEEVDLSTVEDPHVVAGLVKMYLRELPVPLLPYDFYQRFVKQWYQRRVRGSTTPATKRCFPHPHFFHSSALMERSVGEG